MKYRLVTSVACVALGISVLSRPEALAGVSKVANWASTGGGVDESGYSQLGQINAGNVSRLGLAWSLDLDGEQTLEATPLAIDGVLYFTGSMSNVYAVDAASGRILWRYDPAVGEHIPEKMRRIFAVNRGVAYADGRIFAGTIDGRLVALSAKTGRLEWSTATIAGEAVNTSTGAPRVFRGKVIIGNGGADWGGRGYVTAYDIANGRQLWRFYTAPGTPEENAKDPTMAMAAKTWGGSYWKTGTGGTVWNGITFDPELNHIYIGTGNAGPYDPRLRSPGGGDNLFLASVVALDADTGRYIWHYQVNPREAWDYKATANMIETTLSIDGHPRKVLMQAPTNGFFYILDRQTGALIAADKIGKVTWASRIDLKTGRPVEAQNIRYETGSTAMWPSPFGTHNWQAMSFSPRTGLVYIPAMQLGVRYSTAKGQGASFGGLTILPVKADAGDGKGSLLAWDPIARKARWTVPYQTMWNGGTLVTAGDLVFQGTGGGQFAAFNAGNGKRLWSFDAGLGIIAAPITYAVNDIQYVSVLVGYGGATGLWSEIFNVGWKFGAQPRRLLTFRLDGKAILPPTAPPDLAVHAVDDPHIRLDEAAVARGATLFATNCAMCHGRELHSAGAPAPDLRESVVALDPAAFQGVVHDGQLTPLGMPRFSELSDQSINDLSSYIRAGAREALGRRKRTMSPTVGSHV